MSGRKKYINRIYQILLILLVFTMFSFWMLSNLYARYTTEAASGDGARTAAFVFDVNSTVSTNSIPIETIQKPGDTAVYDITITNKNASGKVSEVAESYTVEVSINGSMPLSCTMKKKNTSDQAMIEINNYDSNDHNDGTDAEAAKVTNEKENTKQTFSSAAEQTDQYQLKVAWPSDKNDAMYANGSGQAEVVLTITGTQVD